MLYEVITILEDRALLAIQGPEAAKVIARLGRMLVHYGQIPSYRGMLVITSYSIHYTKLYECSRTKRPASSAGTKPFVTR